MLPDDILPGELIRANVDDVEAEFLKHPQVPCPVIHRYGPGVYIREVNIPAGTLAIGHHQNYEHTNILLKGRVTILNDDGSTSELCAPMMFVGKPGRKIGYIHEDMTWLNVYATEETDVDKLESMFITKSEFWLNDHQNRGLLLLQSDADVKDYEKVLIEFGFTEDQARSQSENTDDIINLPYGGYGIKVADSSINGKGLFATMDYQAGDLIAPARISGKRTIAGRYTNHSANPNAKMVKHDDGDIDLVAVRQILGGHGGQNGQEITIDYREALKLSISSKQEV